MTAFTTMDVPAIKRIREILTEELPGILEPYGLTFAMKNAKYDDDSVTFTGFTISLEGALSDMEKHLTRELKDRAEYDWLVELDVTKVAASRGKNYSLVGFKPRNRKYPFICKDASNGKNYKFTKDAVEAMFAVANA